MFRLFTGLLQFCADLTDHPCDRRRLLQLCAAGSLLTLVPACSSSPLRVAIHHWPGYELLLLAQREGWLSPASGLLLPTSSATASLEALSRNQADAAALTLDELLTARSKGIPLTIVLVFDISTGADLLMVRPGITRLQQLAGARIGVEQTALGALMLALILQTAGLSAGQLTVVNLPPEQHLSAWQQHRLDAAITYEPQASLLRTEGAQALYDSSRMPGMIMDVLAVRTNLLDRSAPQIQGVIAAHFKGLRHLRLNPQDAAYRIADLMGVKPQQVQEGLRGLQLPSLEANRNLLTGDPPPLYKAAETLNRVMVEHRLLPRPDSLRQLATAGLLPRQEV